jgi:cation:H+ antiporter
MLQSILFLVAGLFIVVKGADWLVEGASSLARRIGVSELAIGLTVVAFGTSMPELSVNLLSALNGSTDIAIGNIVGSNIANILLILGIAAIISPMTVQTSTVWKEIPFSLLAAVLVLIMANDHIIDGLSFAELTRSDGLSLIAFFLIFLWYTFGMSRVDDGTADESKKWSLPMATVMILGGLGLLIVGGKFTVDGATGIATVLGVSQSLIGLTVVAVGTSIPELATSVVAAMKKKADIAVGNVVGSNIFNIFWILGISAVIRPLPFRPEMSIDLLVAIFATVLLFFSSHTGYRRILFWKQKEGHIINRVDGWCMLASYVLYTGYLVWRG